MTAPQQPRTPSTEAGRRLLDGVQARGSLSDFRMLRDAILAIEADLLAQIEKAVLGLPEQDGDWPQSWVQRSAVLAAIRAATPVEPTERHPEERHDAEHEAWHRAHPGVPCAWYEERTHTDPLPDGACAVMGLCEEPKGHDGPHYTSVERAARLADPASAAPVER